MTRALPACDIGRLIHSLRGQRVILDSDLAALYGVTTKRLNEQFRRNLNRFPEDFAFRLKVEDWLAIRSQVAVLEIDGGIRSQIATASKRNIRVMVNETVMPMKVVTVYRTSKIGKYWKATT
jgi:hypothetical protein